MAAPPYRPEIDTNGTRQPTDPAGFPQAVKDDGLREQQIVANSGWNWLFKTINDWIGYFVDAGAGLFDVEHDPADGTHTDVTADTLGVDGVTYLETGTWGAAMPAGGPVAVDTRTAGTGVAAKNILSKTVPADYVGERTLARMQGGVKVDGVSASTLLSLDVEIDGTAVVTLSQAAPQVGDILWVEAEFVFDDGASEMDYTVKMYKALASGTNDVDVEMGSFAFDETQANDFQLFAHFTGGAAGDTFTSRTCSLDIYKRD